jgi:DNA polymerase III alpha subunit
VTRYAIAFTAYGCVTEMELKSSRAHRGLTDAEIAAVWKLLIGFMCYAFCRALSTAYGVEAYEAAHRGDDGSAA